MVTHHQSEHVREYVEVVREREDKMNRDEQGGGGADPTLEVSSEHTF